MDINRLLFRAYIEVPYTIDLDVHPESDTEDGEIKMFFKGDEVMDIVPYGNAFGISRWWIRNYLKKLENYSDFEKWSIERYFEDNNSCADDDFIIIDYTQLHQCTTIWDRNKQLIFEGDYVRIPEDDWHYVTNNPYEIYEVVFKSGSFRLRPRRYDILTELYLDMDGIVEIVGNTIEGVLKSV